MSTTVIRMDPEKGFSEGHARNHSGFALTISSQEAYADVLCLSFLQVSCVNPISPDRAFKGTLILGTWALQAFSEGPGWGYEGLGLELGFTVSGLGFRASCRPTPSPDGLAYTHPLLSNPFNDSPYFGFGAHKIR